jgi:hypothetical protein
MCGSVLSVVLGTSGGEHCPQWIRMGDPYAQINKLQRIHFLGQLDALSMLMYPWT